MESIHKFDIIDFNNNIFKFLLKHITEDGFFKLTVNSDVSSYSHCFGIFILNNVDRLSEFEGYFPIWGEYISNEIVLDAEEEKELTKAIESMAYPVFYIIKEKI